MISLVDFSTVEALSGSDTLSFLLIRHGESVSSTKQIVGGHLGCSGLTPLGRAQAVSLSVALEVLVGGIGERPIHCSNIERSIETAEIATSRSRQGFIQSCGVCETHPGSLDGLYWSDLDHGDASLGLGAPIGPGAESQFEMAERVDQYLGSLAMARETVSQSPTALIFTHAGVIRACYSIAGAYPLAAAFRLPVDLCSVHLLQARLPTSTSSNQVRSFSELEARIWRVL